MTPDARLQAAIELLDQIEGSNRRKGLAPDDILKAYFRKRRYAGSKDRRAIRALVFDVLRDWSRARWLAREGGLPDVGRSWAVAFALANDADMLALFGSGAYGPDALTDPETQALATVEAAVSNVPAFAQFNIPEDVFEALSDRYGDAIGQVVPDPKARAPITLRVNAHQASVEDVSAQIEQAGLQARPAEFARDGLVLQSSHDVPDLAVVKDGLAEVQDEASQLCALMVSPPPGGLVVDLCAGAGGKTLAIAARYPKQRILACDISQKRLDNLRVRAERAQLTNIDVILLPPDFPKEMPPELASLEGKAHWALIDAPCSSSGTWARHPSVRHRYDMNDVAGFAAIQSALARAGLNLVRPGGRLTFATCSVLPQEGEAVMAQLLSGETGLTAMDYQALLAPSVKKMPDTLSNVKEWLLLSPPHHGCDGFFCGTVRRPA